MLCFPSGRYYQIYATLNNIDHKLRCHQWKFFDKLNYSKTIALSTSVYYYVIKET